MMLTRLQNEIRPPGGFTLSIAALSVEIKGLWHQPMATVHLTKDGTDEKMEKKTIKGEERREVRAEV